MQGRIDELNGNLEEGRKYKFKYIAGKTRKSIGTFKGTLIKEYDNYYLFKNVLGYRECFLKVDFAISGYKVEEVG